MEEFKTIEAAKLNKYGAWAGDPKGSRYVKGRCAEEVWGEWHSHQCYRKNGCGINNLYCWQHAKTAKNNKEI